MSSETKEDIELDEDEDRKEAEDELEEEEDEDEDEDEEDEEEEDDEEDEEETSKSRIPDVGDDDDEDDEEGETVDDGLDKEDYLKTHHPEVIFPDSTEVEHIMSSYTREKDPVIRRSKPILTKYEAASIVGMRSQQIVQGSSPFVEVPTDDPIEIAEAELKSKIIPVIIRRILTNGVNEYWRLSELKYYG
jgi:DNA-directed RNA polymerase subunit K/omega